MSTRRLYLTCVAAYLTGWPIANAIFNRVVRYMRREAIEAEHHEWRDELADRIALTLRAMLRADMEHERATSPTITRSGDTVTLDDLYHGR